MLDVRNMSQRIGTIVAARTGSRRLPGKALRPLGGLPMIVFLLDRIRHSRESKNIILATTELPEDDDLAEIASAAGYSVFRGANDDVVDRYVNAARAHGLDFVIRVTGDCPFVDSESLDYCVAQAREQASFDLASTKGRFPTGIDYEIFSALTMEKLHEGGELTAEDREHLTLFMYRNEARFRLVHLEPRSDWRADLAFTVDTPDDYLRAQDIVSRFGRKATLAQLVRNGS